MIPATAVVKKMIAVVRIKVERHAALLEWSRAPLSGPLAIEAEAAFLVDNRSLKLCR